MRRAIHWTQIDTVHGSACLGVSEKGVCYLAFDGDPAGLRKRFPKAYLVKDGDLATGLARGVKNALADPAAAAAIPLDLHGTEFQLRVWQELRRIPAGQTRSYGQLAKALGDANASRAVGTANGQNPVGVLVPCHRVIAANGTLGGYAGGIAMKQRLLEAEGARFRRPEPVAAQRDLFS